MNCPGCGRLCDPGARFCSGCGRRLLAEPETQPYTRIFRPREGRMIAGVCAGLALRYGWDVTIVRLVFALLVLLCGLPILFYLVAWIVMPNGDYSLPPTTGVTTS